MVLSMWTCKNISHIQVYLLFSNPTHKTKAGTANRWESTNQSPPRSIKLSSQSETGISQEICVYWTLQGLLQGPGSCALFKGQSSLLVDALDMTAAPHPRFPAQGHILSTGGDALMQPGKCLQYKLQILLVESKEMGLEHTYSFHKAASSISKVIPAHKFELPNTNLKNSFAEMDGESSCNSEEAVVEVGCAVLLQMWCSYAWKFRKCMEKHGQVASNNIAWQTVSKKQDGNAVGRSVKKQHPRLALELEHLLLLLLFRLLFISLM